MHTVSLKTNKLHILGVAIVTPHDNYRSIKQKIMRLRFSSSKLQSKKNCAFTQVTLFCLRNLPHKMHHECESPLIVPSEVGISTAVVSKNLRSEAPGQTYSDNNINDFLFVILASIISCNMRSIQSIPFTS